ncbi:MULE domain-containing protein [Caerostris darwini]|uniref:MULE domain-containing protein n=1 Tax=Caerostris darwini TaxID=1538125 RepID=A0AAV4S8B3_9ARAC|nr:MULE domain-containing protein [Caerostris darwini]
MYQTWSEKEKIAHKLSQNTAMESILDEIRNSVHDNFERIPLLTLQDIKNIKKEFNINQNGVLHVNEKVSIHMWLEKCRNDEDSPILLYKDQNNINDALYPGMKTEDFLLVKMNSSQKEMLKSYGDDIICLDFTYGMNSYGLDLATVLVLDDKREGFPATFIISNHQDRVALEVLLKLLKKQFKQNYLTKLFNRLLQIEKGKMSNKMHVLRNSHISGKQITSISIQTNDGEWVINSSRTAETYTVSHEINTPYEDMKKFKILVYNEKSQISNDCLFSKQFSVLSSGILLSGVFIKQEKE